MSVTTVMNSRSEPLARVMDQIEYILSHLLQKSRATCVLLADISGQLISSVGEISQLDPGAVSALSASDISATAELARQLGESKPFRILFHEGERHHLYLSVVGSSLILIVVFAATVPIGLVRLFTERAVKELLQLTSEFEAALEQVGGAFSESFEESLADELEDAFGQL
jgi:predicted regulator of Ras-like GTPase activity (Roadblock/LC7/MglB family)